MDRIKSGLRLLALFSIFFIYKAIMAALDNNANEIILWTLITIIYIVSLTISYFVIAKWEKGQNK